MKVLAFICICLFFVKCKDPAEITDEAVNKKLEEMRQHFIQDKEKECNKMLMQEIEEQADSILIYLSKKVKYDSLTIPYDSIRPEKPAVIFPEYIKPEKPKETILKDSIPNVKLIKPK